MSPVVGSLPWTPEEDDLLRELALSGEHAAAIAGQIKRSEAAIRKRATLLDVKLAKVQRFGRKEEMTRRCADSWAFPPPRNPLPRQIRRLLIPLC
jgi:hypothetical protein